MKLWNALALLSLSTLLPAQQPAVSGYAWLAGRVADENNAPLSGTEVTLKQPGTLERRAFADPTGAFTLDLGRTGEYTVSVSRPGYFDLQQRRIQIEPGENQLTLTLSRVRDRLESLDVSGASAPIDLDTAHRGQQLSTKELQEVPYRNNNDLRNAMRVLPSVIQDQNGGIHVHGAAEQQVLYTLDGFNIADPLTGTFQSRLSVEGVQSMTVVSGAVPAEYGKGAAGAFVVNTRNGDDPFRYSATNFVPGVEYRGGLTIGSWNPRFNVSGPIQKGKIWFSNSMAAQYIENVVNGLPAGQNRNWSWRYTDNFRVQANLSPSNILYVGVLGNYWIAPDSGLSALDPKATTVNRKATQWFADVKDQIYLGRGSLVEFGYASNRTFGQQIPQGNDLYLYTPYGRQGNYFVDGKQRSSRDQGIANYFLPSFHFLGEHRVKAGVDLDRLNYWQNIKRTGFVYFFANNTPAREVTFAGSGLLDRADVETSAYVQDSWRVKPGLLMELGVRADRDTILKNWNVAPRVGFAWSPRGWESTKISGGYGIVYNATNLQQFTLPMDQAPVNTFYPALGLPSTSVSTYLLGRGLATPRFQNFTLGWEQRFGAGIFTSVQGIARRGSHGLTYSDTTGLAPLALYVLQDHRRDDYTAVEFTIRQNLRRQYQWLASYTRSVARSTAVLDPTTDQPLIIGANNSGRLPWDAPNRVVSWGFLPTFWKKWSIAYLAEWHSGFPFSVLDAQGAVLGEVSSYRFPNFFEVDLGVEREIELMGQRWAWRMGVNNLTNHRNYSLVNNQSDSPQFLQFYGNQGRGASFRVRWLGK
jgi:hypothetical protein